LHHSVGNVQGSRPLVVARTAVTNFVLLVIDEAHDRPVGTDGPSREHIQESYGIEIQRIRALPVRAIVVAEIFSIWSDSHPPSTVDLSDSGAVAARLLCSELPGFASVGGKCGRAERSARVFVIAAHDKDSVFVAGQ